MTLVSRMVHNLEMRRIGHFVAELVLIVAGILIALAIDGWVGDRHDRRTEDMYLELLARDVAKQQEEAARQHLFESELVSDGAQAYALLTTADPAAHAREIGRLLTALSGRRTINIESATYDQMVSSGHLQLIRDPELRDRIVRHFASMVRYGLIIGKNNQDLVDDIYAPFLMRQGISATYDGVGPERMLTRAAAIQRAALGPDFETPIDAVLTRPADAASWDDIRRNVLFRMRIAAVGQSLAESIGQEAEGIARAIDTGVAGGTAAVP